MLILFVCNIHARWSQSLIYVVLSFFLSHSMWKWAFASFVPIAQRGGHLPDIFRGQWPCLGADD